MYALVVTTIGGPKSAMEAQTEVKDLTLPHSTKVAVRYTKARPLSLICSLYSYGSQRAPVKGQCEDGDEGKSPLVYELQLVL